MLWLNLTMLCFHNMYYDIIFWRIYLLSLYSSWKKNLKKKLYKKILFVWGDWFNIHLTVPYLINGGLACFTPLPLFQTSHLYLSSCTSFNSPSDKRHVDWVHSYLLIWTEMQSFIKQHHTTGLVWSKTVSTQKTVTGISTVTHSFSFTEECTLFFLQNVCVPCYNRCNFLIVASLLDKKTGIQKSWLIFPALMCPTNWVQYWSQEMLCSCFFPSLLMKLSICF